MRALLLISHGSRRSQSNDEVVRLARMVAEQAGDRFDLVQAAFLEIAEPSIPDGLAQCAASGATEIVVVPHFLAAGRHVADDIPVLVQGFIASSPHIKVSLAPHLGGSPLIVQAILATADTIA